MPLSTYALVSLDELRGELLAKRPDVDDALAAVINRVSGQVESFLDRQVVTRGALTEYHSIPCGPPWTQELYTLEFPILTVTSVAEDASWQSTASASRYATALTVNTDYIVSQPSGQLFRVGTYWATGERAIKVVYTAGYATTAAVPWPIKDVVIRLCALAWRDSDKQEWGLLSRSDATGTVNRFVPAVLTDQMKHDLYPYRRHGSTGVRDAA